MQVFQSKDGVFIHHMQPSKSLHHGVRWSSGWPQINEIIIYFQFPNLLLNQQIPSIQYFGITSRKYIEKMFKGRYHFTSLPILLFILTIYKIGSAETYSSCLTATEISQIPSSITFIDSQGLNSSQLMNQEILTSAQIYSKAEILSFYSEYIYKIGESYLIQIEQQEYQLKAKKEYQDPTLIDWETTESEDDDDDRVVGFSSGSDVWVYIKPDPVILTCNQKWTAKIGCGTFLEVHRPFQEELLVSKQIQEDDQNFFNIPINSLCSGAYHIWFVYVTRIGKVVKTVEPIFISSDFCQCLQQESI